MLEQYDSSDFLTGWGGGGGQLGRVQSAPFDWPEAQKKLGNFTGTINLNYCLQADNQRPQHREGWIPRASGAGGGGGRGRGCTPVGSLRALAGGAEK